MSILAWILVGLIAGLLAKLAMPGPDPGGLILTMIIGIVGALVGGFLFQQVNGPGVTGVNVSSILMATVGAVILLAIYRLITRLSA